VAEYIDLTIRIGAWESAGGAYPVEASLSDGSRYRDGQLKLDWATLRAQALNPALYGQTLFNALFPAGGKMRQAYDTATGQARQAADGLRVRLEIDADAAELHAVNWERLYDLTRPQPGPLATADRSPFSRYVSLEMPEPPPVAGRPLKMLAAVANPTGLPAGFTPVEVEKEIEILRAALGPLRRGGQVEVALLPGRTGLPAALQAALEAEGYQVLAGPTTLEAITRHVRGRHLFHFVGHGQFNRKDDHGPGRTTLFLENEAGGLQIKRDDEIVPDFAAMEATRPHLIFLVACETAVREVSKTPEAAAEHPFVGLGPKLVAAGVPAVVAMQDRVPIDTARQLTEAFYRRLAEGGVVDLALNQARLQIHDQKRTDWAIPVLFMRLRTGKLFLKVGETPEGEAPTVVNQTTIIQGDFVGRDKITQTNQINTGGAPVDISIGGGRQQTPPPGGGRTTAGGGDGGGVVFNVKGDVSVGGHVAGRDITGEGRAEGEDGKRWVVLEQRIEKAYETINALGLGDGDKDDLRGLAANLETEVKKGEAADLRRVERNLTNMKAISTEAAAAMARALTHVAARVPDAIQAVARKFL